MALFPIINSKSLDGIGKHNHLFYLDDFLNSIDVGDFHLFDGAFFRIFLACSVIAVRELQDGDGDAVLANKVERKGGNTAVVISAGVAVELSKPYLTLNCSKLDSSSRTKEELL